MEIPIEHIVLAAKAIFGALTTAVAVQWFWFQSQFRRLSARADECEKDREQMWEDIGKLRERGASLEQCPSTACPVRAARTLPQPMPLGPSDYPAPDFHKLHPKPSA